MAATMVRYDDCQREDGDCTVCSLSSYGKDCRMAPVNKISYLRKRSSLTQADLANRINVTQPWVAKLERGEISIENITLKNAIALSDALGVDVKELL